MRITCPSCASHFELPSELLGKKGRALKCATCQHSWYQAAQVESLDLASVMGEDYAAQAVAAPVAAARPVQAQAAKQGAQPQRGASGGIQRVPPIPNARAEAAAQNARNILAGAIGVVESQRNVQAAAIGGPRQPGRNVQAAPLRQQQPNAAPAPGAPPLPPGAVSMMSRRNQQRPQNQAQPTTAQSWFAGTARSGAAGGPQPGAAGAPGAPPQAAAVLAGQSMRGQAVSPNAPGQAAVSWMQQPGGQPGAQAAPIGMGGASAGPGAAPLPGQSMRGQAGSAPAPGQGAVSWMSPQGQVVPPGTPGAVPVAMPPGMAGGPGAMPGAIGGPGQLPPGAMPGMAPGIPPGMAPGAMGAMGAMGAPGANMNVRAAPLGAPGAGPQTQAAALAGQSMRGQAGAAAAPGQGAVSWMQQPGAQQPGVQSAPLGAPRAAAGPGATPLPGQSMRGQAGAPAGPGEAAVSWMKQGAQGAPGQAGQSMMNQGLPAGPGAAAVSQISNEIVAPGQGARSLLDGSQVGGVPGQSMMGAAGGPGQAGQSMTGAPPGGPGQPGQSMLENPAAGGPGVSGAPGAAGAAQAGQSMKEAGASGGPGASTGPGAAGGAPAAEDDPLAEAGTSGGPGASQSRKKDEPQLVAMDPKAPKPEPELKTDPSRKKDAGASGGPGAKAGAADGAPGAAKADEEDDLVDPDADRPNFGSAPEEEAEEDAEENSEDGFAQVASRAGRGQAAPVKVRKPLDPAYTTAIMMTGFVGIIVATLWFARAELAKLLPQIQALYDKVGVEAPRPGDGLSIAESSKRLQRISGVETLVVRGYVANIGDIPRTVPGLRLELYNEKREVIQAQTAKPPAGLLDPAASAEFEIRLELPQLSQAKGGYAVVWDIE